MFAFSANSLCSAQKSSVRAFSRLADLRVPSVHTLLADVINNTRTQHSMVCTAKHSTQRELQAIRGVGPVNATLLAAQDIKSVARLQHIYHVVCKGDRHEMQRFLSETVGIRNAHHCRTAVEHINSLQWSGLAVSIKLAVEGNIGAGKSTFLDMLTDGQLELQDIMEVVPEPVDQWRSVANGDLEPINLLDHFYKDPQRYAYTFQHYVLLTRMQKDRQARASLKPLRMLERSIFSDRMVFVRAMHEAGYMGDLELSVYDSWFAMEIQQDSALTPDGFIYLKARPETCIRRLRCRNRTEESGISEEYLQSLHAKHESWLHFGARGLDEYVADRQASEAARLVQTTSAMQRSTVGLDVSPQLAAASADGKTLHFSRPQLELLQSAPASIRDSIVFLGQGDEVLGGREQGKIMRALNGVPALVLDHEQSDILNDPDARQEYARKVKVFSEYVGMITQNTRAGLEVQQSHGPGLAGAPSRATTDQLCELQHIVKEHFRRGQHAAAYQREVMEPWLREDELLRLLSSSRSGSSLALAGRR